MSGYTALLAVLLIVTLAALHCTASKSACFKKYNQRKGCSSKDRGMKRGVKLYDCCKKHQGGGWTAPNQAKKDCKPCTKKELVTSMWSDWGPWEACNATCGVSVSVRRRNCKVSSGPPKCKGSNEKTKACDVPPCPIDGGWSDWSDWTQCSVTCEKGIQYRRRVCDNPVPRHGGSECKGSLEKSRKCVMNAHCPIHGGWGEWGQWSDCSKSCDIGTKERRRPCDNPKPEHGGRPCNASEAVDIDYCREERCVITGVGDYSGSGSGSGNGWGSGSGSGDNYSGESGDGWENSGSGSGSATGEGSGSGSGSGAGSGAGGSGSGSSDRGSRRRRRQRRNLYFPDEE